MANLKQPLHHICKDCLLCIAKSREIIKQPKHLNIKKKTVLIKQMNMLHYWFISFLLLYKINSFKKTLKNLLKNYSLDVVKNKKLQSCHKSKIILISHISSVHHIYI